MFVSSSFDLCAINKITLIKLILLLLLIVIVAV